MFNRHHSGVIVQPKFPRQATEKFPILSLRKRVIDDRMDSTMAITDIDTWEQVVRANLPESLRNIPFKLLILMYETYLRVRTEREKNVVSRPPRVRPPLPPWAEELQLLAKQRATEGQLSIADSSTSAEEPSLSLDHPDGDDDMIMDDESDTTVVGDDGVVDNAFDSGTIENGVMSDYEFDVVFGTAPAYVLKL